MAAQRWTHIDSIRGLAAMAVLYFHIGEYAFKRDLVSKHSEFCSNRVRHFASHQGNRGREW